MGHIIVALEGYPRYLDSFDRQMEALDYRIEHSSTMVGGGPEVLHVDMREIRFRDITFRDEIKDMVLADLDFPGGTIGRGALYDAMTLFLPSLGLEPVVIPDTGKDSRLGVKHVNLFPLGYKKDALAWRNGRYEEAL